MHKRALYAISIYANVELKSAKSQNVYFEGKINEKGYRTFSHVSSIKLKLKAMIKSIDPVTIVTCVYKVTSVRKL